MSIKQIKAHLAQYKEEKLNIYECGEYWKNKKKYGHILPLEKKYENIIDQGFKNDLIKYLSDNSEHLGFHHLNSSQALALNLFGPLFEKRKVCIIDSSMKENQFSAKFEHIEDKREETNFDVFIESGNDKYFFEVKYSENNFGKAKDDIGHKQKYEEIYKEKLKEITDISENEFYKDYQLWRNILYAEKGIVYFVIPGFRDDLINQIENAKKKIKNENLKEKIKIIIIEELVKKCKKEPALVKHYEEFEEKYLNF
ncbi:MAG: hypothetical protein IKX23_00275 [Treponema sp.]|nr:hypothetical protein [Treponema sp.]